VNAGKKSIHIFTLRITTVTIHPVEKKIMSLYSEVFVDSVRRL
jgi:hypothetical protein